MDRLFLFSMAVCTALVFGTTFMRSSTGSRWTTTGTSALRHADYARAGAEGCRRGGSGIEEGIYPQAIAVVEPSGDLVLLVKLENTQYAGPEIAIRKARTSARFRVPTTVFFNAVEAGHPYLMSLTPELTAADGGTVIVENGKVIGAIGVSGAPAGSFDATVARAGAAAIQ